MQIQVDKCESCESDMQIELEICELCELDTQIGHANWNGYMRIIRIEYVNRVGVDNLANEFA